MRIFLNRCLRRCERGATAIEYGLIAALIAMSVLGTVMAVGDSVGLNWERVETSYNEANG